MTPEQVEQLIKAKDTKITTVSFIKADGSIRVINGLFKPSSKIVRSERGAAQGSFGKKSYCEETPLTREQQIELVETAKHRRNDMIKRLGCGEYDMLRHNANTDKGFK
jgi:hypothetical protein